MKREIKFRAWDGNQMIYDGNRIYPSFYSQELRDVCSPVVVTNREVYFWVYESRLKDERDYFDHISYLPIKDIMQFTGLHDKNGKEIYEGDIIRVVNCHPDHKDKRFQVIFRTGAFQMWPNEDPPVSFIYYAYSAFKHGEDIDNPDDIGNWIEVIGNIYSNPDLL